MSKERVEKLRKRVAADPYDAAAWEDLVSEADRCGEQGQGPASSAHASAGAGCPAAGAWRQRRRHCLPKPNLCVPRLQGAAWA